MSGRDGKRFRGIVTYRYDPRCCSRIMRPETVSKSCSPSCAHTPDRQPRVSYDCAGDEENGQQAIDPCRPRLLLPREHEIHAVDPEYEHGEQHVSEDEVEV